MRRQGIPASRMRIAAVHAQECEICKGLLANLPEIATDVSKKLKGFEFDTFLIGASIPQTALDKEDEIRALLKIRGKEGVKTEITRTISKHVAKSLKRKVNYSRPDITVLVSLPDRNISITPRSIWLFARYRKKVRGIAQRSSPCKICNGVGCAQCDYKGFADGSVQTIVNDFLMKKYQAENCGFIWVGSEDERSLVNGSGRPFYVEVKKPKKRKATRGLSKTVDLGSVSLSSIETLSSRPKHIPQFKVKCLAYLVQKEPQREKSGPLEMNEKIESVFMDSPVRVKVSRGMRDVNKRVHSVIVKKNKHDHPFVLEIECDGGIPIRKLVSGEDDSVSPNLSQYLDNLILDPEMPFDIQEIMLTPTNQTSGRFSKSNPEGFLDH